MREMLFRGKRKGNDEWVFGNFVSGCLKEYAYIVEFGNKELCRNYVDIYPDTVGQFTGLTDKNGEKVFEGDIVFLGLIPCVVKYDAANARFMFYDYGEYLRNGFNVDTMKLKEVIGNIYDNPELLLGGANNS